MARYRAAPAGRPPLSVKPTFASANATRAKANTSMISSVHRLLRDAGGSGPVGSTAGDGVVMLLTKPQGTGRGHEGRCSERWEAGTSRTWDSVEQADAGRH